MLVMNRTKVKKIIFLLLSHFLKESASTITQLGDKLFENGMINAAHLCYLIANKSFDEFSNPDAKLVLVGVNHNHHRHNFFDLQVIQRTEVNWDFFLCPISCRSLFFL